MAIRAMMVDENVDHAESVRQYFSNSSIINSVLIFSNCEDALSTLNEGVDVVILDCPLDNGCRALIERIKNLKIPLIFISKESNCEIINILNECDNIHYLHHPYDFETLEKVINNLRGIIEVNSKLKLKISELLHTLGVPSHIKGYGFIREGIALMYYDTSMMQTITKRLYPTIATKFATTSSRVERAIRHAIELSWIRGDIVIIEEIFGNSIDYNKAKPTNSEFMATLADKIRLDGVFR